jgi:ATP-binding cassette subfamily B protein
MGGKIQKDLCLLEVSLFLRLIKGSSLLIISVKCVESLLSFILIMKNQLMKFLKYLSHYRWQILLLFAGLSLQVRGALQLPDMMSQIVNRGIVGGDQHFILTQGLRMLLIAVIGGCGMLIAGFFASRIGAGLAKTLRKDVYAKTMSFSITELNQFSISSLITRSTNDVNQIQMVITMVLRMSLQAPLMGVGAILKALDTAPSMTRIIMLAIASLLVVLVMMFLIVIPKFTLLQKLVDKLNLVARENLTGLRVVRAFNREKREEDKFAETNKELTKLNLFVNKTMGLMSPFISLILNFTSLGIIRFGASAIESGAIEVGNMMAFLQYAMQVMMSFMFLAMLFIMVPRAAVSRKRLTEVLNMPLSIQPPKHPQTPPADKHGEVEFRDVSFTYADGSEPVLNHLSFIAKAGQTTAFIGSTGSGKSTLINLIPRLYDVSAGQVLVDGLDVREYDPEVLMKKI